MEKNQPTFKDIYTLQELIKSLEKIKEQGSGTINFPKALYCIALEIDKLKKGN